MAFVLHSNSVVKYTDIVEQKVPATAQTVPGREAGMSGLNGLYHSTPFGQPAKEFFVMTKGDGFPCERCGTSEWYKGGDCKECKSESSRQWQAKNPEKARESKRRWYANNREMALESSRRWQEENPERLRENNRRWRAKNPDRLAVYNHCYHTRKTNAGGSCTPEEFKQLCDLYDNRCVCCGKKKPLEFDHVIPVAKGGTSDISNGQPLCRSCNAKKGAKTTDYRTKSGILRWIQKRLL